MSVGIYLTTHFDFSYGEWFSPHCSPGDYADGFQDLLFGGHMKSGGKIGNIKHSILVYY